MKTLTTHQFTRGQDILIEETLHVNRALHGHRMYFLPAGGGLIGWERFKTLTSTNYFTCPNLQFPELNTLLHITLFVHLKNSDSSFLAYRGLLTVSTLHNTLVFPSSDVDELLAHSADHWWFCVHWHGWGIWRRHFRVSWWGCPRSEGGRTYNNKTQFKEIMKILNTKQNNTAQP